MISKNSGDVVMSLYKVDNKGDFLLAEFIDNRSRYVFFNQKIHLVTKQGQINILKVPKLLSQKMMNIIANIVLK